MKKGVKVWGVIAVLIAIGLLFMGIVSTEVIVADVNKDIAATNVNVTHTSPKGDLELVRGDYETDTSTKNKTEWIKVTPTPTHDMVVTNVNTTPSSPDLEQPTVIHVTVANEGEQQEDNVSVKVYVDSAQIGTTQYISLAPGSSNTTTFLWSPTTAKAYSVKGEVEIVNGELDVKDNTKSIKVRVSAVPTPMPGTPSNPSPSNHTTDVYINTNLDWSDCSNTNFYDLYFGTYTHPPYYGNAPTSNYPFQNDLEYGTKYYWKIEAKSNGGGNTSGPIWDFNTEEAPNQQPTAIIDSITPDPAEQGTDTVSFTGHGTDPDGTVEAYNWSSSMDGPLSTSAAFTKPASELSVGTHAIYFKVQDNDGAWSTEDTEDLTITPANVAPTAIIDSITTDPAVQGTDTVSFSGHGTDTDGTVVAYNWSSSIDGQLSTSAAFTKPASELSVGTHTIYFKVQDNDGAWSTEDTEDLTITPANVAPTAIIDSITPDPAEQGTDTVSFSGHGTDTDGTVVAYNWSSSIDGQLSTSASFTKPASELSVGTHTIYFKVQDNDGAWSTEDTEDLTITPANVPPTAIIDSITPDSAEQGTDTVSFSGHGTDTDGTVVAYNWSSSIDGQLSTSASFTKPASELSIGTHTIYFKVQDNDGAWSTEDTEDLTITPANVPPTAIIDSITPDSAEQGTDTVSVSFSGHGTDTDGTVVAYNWSSSIDGQLSTSASFTKPASELSIGTHTIYFKVQDNDGAWSTEDTEDLTITPANVPPTAIIDSITPDSAEQGTDTVSVSFSGHGTDTDGTVVAYNWSSSIDGQLSTSASFNKPASELSVGTHAIYFKVQDNDGAWSTEDTEDLTITPANVPPTAIIDSITPDSAEQGTDTVSVSFSGHGTDTDGTVVAYNWSSSIDGQLSTSASFNKPASELSVGTHTIYFKVQDDDGAWSTEDTEDLTITPANQQPTAIIDSITPDSAEQGTDTVSVSFSGHGTDTDGTVVAYNWSSSIDGQLSTSAAFTKPASELSVGTHTIYFKVQDNDGAWSTEDTEDLTITPANVPPTAIIDSITPDSAEQGTDTVSFSGHGTDTDGTVVAYNWSSSIDGQLSTSAAFTKPASELSVGTHTIYFKVQDNDGAWSTEDTEDLTINPGPELSYSPESHDFGDMREGETDNTTFEIWNSGTDTLTYSLSETCDWLEVNPTNGSSTGEPNSITVDIDTTGLFEGTHTGDITINSNDGSGTFTVMVNVVPCPCGNKGVNPTSWSPTLNCGESDSQIVTVSASDCIVNGVTVSKVSGPTWLSVSQTDLGDIASGSSETFTVTAAPPAGTSSGDYPYTIRVSNACGSPSSRDVAGTINVNENADGKTDYWAVIVGVADYTGTSHDLAYTDDDAIDLYNTLLLSGDYWQPDHIKLLLDSEADKAGILAAFNWLDDNEDPDDVVLFFFSGHGTNGPDDDGDELDGYDEFICPCDFNNIRDDELDAELDRLGSTSIVVIIDTCFAGGMTKAPDRSVKTLPKQKVELTDGFAKDLQDEKKDMGDAGRVVLMACDDDEYSYEIYELENGLFSYYVIEGLGGPADAEGKGDNICSAEETFVYAEPRVVDIISTQHPQLYDGYIGELPITRPPCPDLSYSPASHNFGDKCERVTDSTTFELWNSGTGTLTYSLSESCGWLEVNPTSGASTGEHDTITVDMDTTGLSEGSHTCDITINSNGGSETFTVTVNVVSYPESSWTYMVYLDGDNNLEGAGINDFMEMSAVGSSPAVNIVVQFDRIPGYVSSYGDWTTCKRFLVTQGMTPMPANAIGDLGECNMGDPNTLKNFVTWAMTEFPADNYALVLWNHGDGWRSTNRWVPWADDDIKDAKDAGLSRGICVDNTNSDYLSLQETEQALTGKYVQLLGYDACLMHMIEVVYQVKANAGVSVGSEESEPGDGWPYDTILSALTGTPTMNEDALGTVIVDRYMDYYGYTGSETQSAMDNSALPNLVIAVDNLAQALINEINTGNWAQVQQARNAAEEIYYNYYIDLYDFAEKIKTDVPGAAIQAQAVMNNVNNTVYAEAHGTWVPNDHGLSIYFPRVEDNYLASYDSTAFASDTQWDEFLKKYYNPPAQGEDIAVFRDGLWALKYGPVNNIADCQPADKWLAYGVAGWTPVAGDYNNDGTGDIAIFQDGWWALKYGPVNAIADFQPADKWLAFGTVGWTPVVGDYNNDGIDDIAIFQDGWWALKYGPVNAIADFQGADKWLAFGTAGWTPVAGDYNNDDIDDIAIFQDGWWALKYGPVNAIADFQPADKWLAYGVAGWTPVVGDYNNDDIDDIAIFQDGWWALKYGPVNAIAGCQPADKWLAYGTAGWTPVVGDFGDP